MHLRFLCAAVAAISGVNALGDLAFNLGVKDNDGKCKTAAEYQNDFKNLKHYASIVKVFSPSDCDTLRILGPEAELAHFKVMLGVWPTDGAHFNAEKEALKSFLPTISRSTVKQIVVGSEALYRKDMTPSELAGAIRSVKELVKNIEDKNGESYASVPVGTADTWNAIVDGASTEAIRTADFILVNVFSFWQGQPISNASYSLMDDVMQAMQAIQRIKGQTNGEFWIGETGWPTNGKPFQGAVPSLRNAALYWKEGICAIRLWGGNVCVFEAQDETWKPDTSGIKDVEKNWGVFDSSYKQKYPLDCES